MEDRVRYHSRQAFCDIVVTIYLITIPRERGTKSNLAYNVEKSTQTWRYLQCVLRRLRLIQLRPTDR